MPAEIARRWPIILLLPLWLLTSCVGQEASQDDFAAFQFSGRELEPFSISPITQLEACRRLRYWFDNFLSSTFEAKLSQTEPDWVDELFTKECPTDRAGGEFFQFVFRGDPTKLQLEFLITMRMDNRSNTVWVLLSHFAEKGDPRMAKFEHNLKVVAYHLATGIAKPELLEK